MARKYRHYSYSGNKLAPSVIGLPLAYFVLLWFTNKSLFYAWLKYGLLAVIILLGTYIAWVKFTSDRKKQKITALLASIQQTGSEQNIINFINSFGYLKKSEKRLWRQGEFSFTWPQLETLRNTLHEKGVKLSVNDYKDLSLILKHYISTKEDKFVRDSISNGPAMPKQLNGAEFETLLCRLYEAMGYSVMKTGKTGDQGCDLVVNMGSERVVVQAKCYSGSVGNSAVQEANTALKIYNCTKAIVVTNSYFTPEAIQLAKVNDVELIGGERLRELLAQYLKESLS